MSDTQPAPTTGTYLRFLGDPILEHVAQSINGKLKNMPRLISTMKGYLRVHRGLGLAAPQIGVPFRVILIQFRVHTEPTVMINPEIIERSMAMDRQLEGCLSIPGFQVSVRRSVSISVRYRDEEFEPKDLHLSGIDARVVQHEVDHLDGKLITDGLSAMQLKAARRCVEKAGRLS